jgi:hypothetical protein
VLLQLALTSAAAFALIAAVGYGVWIPQGPGPGMMPAIGASLVLAAIAASMICENDTRKYHPHRPVLVFAAGLIAIIPVTLVAGLLASLGLFAIYALRICSSVPLKRAIPTALGVAAASWLVFEKLLSVPLPKPMFW